MKTKVIAFCLNISNTDPTKIEDVLTVINKDGVHGRPATLIAVSAMKYKETSIIFVKDGLEVEVTNPISLLAFGAEKGSQMQIKVDGPQAKEAYEEIKALFENKFGEEE